MNQPGFVEVKSGQATAYSRGLEISPHRFLMNYKGKDTPTTKKRGGRTLNQATGREHDQ